MISLKIKKGRERDQWKRRRVWKKKKKNDRDRVGKKEKQDEFRTGVKRSFYVYIATEIKGFHAFMAIS